MKFPFSTLPCRSGAKEVWNGKAPAAPRLQAMSNIHDFLQSSRDLITMSNHKQIVRFVFCRCNNIAMICLGLLPEKDFFKSRSTPENRCTSLTAGYPGFKNLIRNIKMNNYAHKTFELKIFKQIRDDTAGQAGQ